MFLNKVFDPRDNLEKSRRMELFRFAQAMGVTEIKDEMPAGLMRRILRQKNMTNIPPPNRTLGLSEPRGMSSRQPIPQEGRGREVNADDDLARQWEAQSKRELSIQEMRAECKRRRIKTSPRDTKVTLREKLGQNAP